MATINPVSLVECLCSIVFSNTCKTETDDIFPFSAKLSQLKRKSAFSFPEISQILFEKAADYWKEAIRLAPTNYIEAQNWLKMTGRNTGLA